MGLTVRHETRCVLLSLSELVVVARSGREESKGEREDLAKKCGEGWNSSSSDIQRYMRSNARQELRYPS